MTDPFGLLLPDQRYVLRQLAEGGELWLHDFGRMDEARLHYGAQIRRLEPEDIEPLIRRELVRPVLGVTSTLYRITEAGRALVG